MVVGSLNALIAPSCDHHDGCEAIHSELGWHIACQPSLRQRHVASFLDHSAPAETSEATIARLQDKLAKIREDIKVQAAGGLTKTNSAYKGGMASKAVAPTEPTPSPQPSQPAAKLDSTEASKDDGPDAPLSDAAKTSGVADFPQTKPKSASDPKQKPPRSIGQCNSGDGRFIVKVTPDGVRRLYDTSEPGMILSRIQCDGEAPKGDHDDCNKVSWPCENIRRPFPGYIEEITDQIKPLCQSPGWHGLFVGLGGGYMQTNLAKLCAADARLDTVESTPGVVPIAKNAFGFNPRDPKQHLEFGDALHAMKDHSSAGDKYDFIFTDYKSAGDKSFMHAAHDLLKPSGRLAFSKTGEYQEDWLDALRDYFTPAKATKTAEGNFTLMATPKVLSKDVQVAPEHSAMQQGAEVHDAKEILPAKEPAHHEDVEAKEAVLKAQEMQ